jgi:hypothetical protein
MITVTPYYALGGRLWNAAAGAPCSSLYRYRSDTRDNPVPRWADDIPSQKGSPKARGEVETTRTVRRAQGKVGRMIELARGPRPPHY